MSEDQARPADDGERTDPSTTAQPGASPSARPDMDMTRERARSERRDVDKERGEPLAGAALRADPRALRTPLTLH